MHERHLLQLLSGILEWVDPPDAVSKAIENGKSDRFGMTHILVHIPASTQFYLFTFDPQIGSGFIQ